MAEELRLKPPVIVFDIDGVILDTRFIHKEILELHLKGEDKYKYFYKHCNSDRTKLMSGIKPFYEMLKNKYNAYIVFCTARSEECGQETYDKLLKEGIDDFSAIYMRNKNDLREDTEVKADLLNEIKEKYNILVFIDDSLRNCEVAKKLGILALRLV